MSTAKGPAQRLILTVAQVGGEVGTCHMNYIATYSSPLYNPSHTPLSGDRTTAPLINLVGL